MEYVREYAGQAVEAMWGYAPRVKAIGWLVVMLLLDHMVQWAVGWMYYEWCSKSFFTSLLTNGSYVCTSLDAVRRSSLTKYGAAVAGMITW